MFNFNIRLIKNSFLFLLFSVLVSTLFSKYQQMRVEAAFSGAASTSVPSQQQSFEPKEEVNVAILPAKLTSNILPTEIIVHTVTPTSAPLPTEIPVTMTPKSTEPTEKPTLEIKALPPDDVLHKLNEYRRSKGLSEVTRDTLTCKLAKERVKEVIYNFSHEGFENRIDDGSLPYPHYTEVAENIARVGKDSKHVVEMWIDSPSHRENMEKDTPYVCIAQEGDFYVYEGWKP